MLKIGTANLTNAFFEFRNNFCFGSYIESHSKSELNSELELLKFIHAEIAYGDDLEDAFYEMMTALKDAGISVKDKSLNLSKNKIFVHIEFIHDKTKESFEINKLYDLEEFGFKGFIYDTEFLRRFTYTYYMCLYCNH